MSKDTREPKTIIEEEFSKMFNEKLNHLYSDQIVHVKTLVNTFKTAAFIAFQQGYILGREMARKDMEWNKS